MRRRRTYLSGSIARSAHSQRPPAKTQAWQCRSGSQPAGSWGGGITLRPCRTRVLAGRLLPPHPALSRENGRDGPPGRPRGHRTKRAARPAVGPYLFTSDGARNAHDVSLEEREPRGQAVGEAGASALSRGGVRFPSLGEPLQERWGNSQAARGDSSFVNFRELW